MWRGQHENIQHNTLLISRLIFLFLTKGFYCEYFNLDNNYYVYVTKLIITLYMHQQLNQFVPKKTQKNHFQIGSDCDISYLIT